MKTYRDYDANDASEAARDREMRQCMWEGIYTGLRWSAVSGTIGMGTVFALNKFSPRLGVSGKTGLIASSFFLTFVLGSELTLNDCKRRMGWARLGLTKSGEERE